MWGGDTSAFTNCVLIAAPVVVSVLLEQKIRLMMGERRMMQEALFYGFRLERHVRTITCFARSTGSSTFRRFESILSITQRDGSPFD